MAAPFQTPLVVARFQHDVHYYIELKLRADEARSLVERTSTTQFVAFCLGIAGVGALIILKPFDELEKNLIAWFLALLGIVAPFCRRQYLSLEFFQKRLPIEPMSLEFSENGWTQTSESFQRDWKWSDITNMAEFDDGILLETTWNWHWVPSHAFSTPSGPRQCLEICQRHVPTQKVIRPLEQEIGLNFGRTQANPPQPFRDLRDAFNQVHRSAVIAAHVPSSTEHSIAAERKFRRQDVMQQLSKVANWISLGFVGIFIRLMGGILLWVVFANAMPFWMAGVISGLLVTAIFYVGSKISAARELAALRKRYSGIRKGYWLYEFSSAGYLIEGAGTPTLQGWTSVLKAVEFEDGWMLLSTSPAYTWIPLSSLVNPNAGEKLQQLIFEHAPKYKVFRKLRLPE